MKEVALAEENEPTVASGELELEIQRTNKRLDMLDQRLDNIDSIVTAVAERVLNQPVTLNIVCPNCGKNLEIAIIGSQKPR